jgi:transposase-like protein
MKQRGRPPKYGPAIVAEALRRIAQGESLNRVARELKIHAQTIQSWREKARRAEGRVPDSFRGLLES